MADELVDQLEARLDEEERYGYHGRAELTQQVIARIQSDAAEIARLRAEAFRWHEAYDIAHEQATENGERLRACQAELEARDRPNFAPCPTCHQYSHTIAGGLVEEAALFFTAMDARPGGLPGGYRHDEQTRDMAQRLIAEVETTRASAYARGWNDGMAAAQELHALETGEWEK